MDKTNNLQYFLTDIADAIREKKGTSDLINAQNFADEIRNMPQSGGNAGGGSGMRYIDMRNADPGLLNAMLVASSLAGFNQSGEFIVASAIMLERGMQGVDLDISNNTTAIAVPWDEELRLPIISIRVSDFILANISEDKIKFLTKDEFYNPATYA